MSKKQKKYPKKLISPESYIEEKSMKIFYDKTRQQYTVRIPREFAETLKINLKKDKFKFLLITPPLKDKSQKTRLKGELTNG